MLRARCAFLGITGASAAGASMLAVLCDMTAGTVNYSWVLYCVSSTSRDGLLERCHALNSGQCESQRARLATSRASVGREYEYSCVN